MRLKQESKSLAAVSAQPSTMSGQSCAVKLRAEADHWISCQYKLQVKIKNKYGNPTMLHMTIPSKHNWSIYLPLPTKHEGKIIRFPQMAC